MTYIVIEDFFDLQDGRHLYHAGDSFPRAGMDADAARLDELAGSNNAMRRPLIRAIDAPKRERVETPKPERKTRNKATGARLKG